MKNGRRKARKVRDAKCESIKKKQRKKRMKERADELNGD